MPPNPTATTRSERILIPLLAVGSLIVALSGEPVGWLLLGVWLGRFA